LIYAGITLGLPTFNRKVEAFGTIRKVFRTISFNLNRSTLKSTGNTFLTGGKTKNSCRKNDKK